MAMVRFKRTIAISRPGAEGEEEPILEDGVGYGIASVFVAPEFRGKGYGKHMMRLLHWVLAREEYLETQRFPEEEWGAPPGRVGGAGEGWLSALWSDVGPTFYELCGMGVGSRDGWVVRDPFSTVWKLNEVVVPEDDEGEVVWLDEAMAKEMWEKDAEKIKAELRQRVKEERQTLFSFLPNEGVAMFQWFRLHYHFSRYVRDPPQYLGVRIGEEVFATWTCEFRPGSPRTLTITRLRADKAHVGRVLGCALRYARALGMEAVEAWNLAAGGLGGERVRRTEHYPAVRAYGEGGWRWAGNEKYAWC
jgi:GNAT superfamily N-acetyltransferase